MSPRRILSLVVLLLIITVFIVAASRSPKTELTTAQRNPSVINNTKSLDVVNTVRNDGELYIALRNDYTKNVTAFAISIGNSRFTEDFAYSALAEAGIAPSATYERRIPIADSKSPIQIQAVILDGGTDDGNSTVIQQIRDDRLAGRVQIERSLKLMDNYLKVTTNVKSKMGIGSLKSQLVSELNAPEADSLAALRQLQPARQWNQLSEEAKNALDNGRQNVLREFQAVEDASDKREELIRLKEYYARVLRRL